MLLDLAGNDRYEAQVFAQGVGYYEGLGMLLDDGGNDRFEAAWYAMGAGAHYAAGILLKRGVGNDVYRSTHEMVLGTGNDLSVGVFVDEGGDDEYTVGQLSLGVAHANSTGIFVDGAGNDRYTVMSPTCRALGAAYHARVGQPARDLAEPRALHGSRRCRQLPGALRARGEQQALGRPARVAAARFAQRGSGWSRRGMAASVRAAPADAALQPLEWVLSERSAVW